jgi:diketogulonate reductase-like aldo/keto reductase
MIKDEFYVLSNGVKIPKIAFGTWQVKPGDEAYNSLSRALKLGYKHIDTALAYENEKSVGEAIKDSKIEREELFITTKLPAQIKGYNEAKEAFNTSLKNLDCEYIDLYLIHAPWPWNNIGQDCEKENIESWKAMIELYNEGKIRAIGVSNFRPEHIKPLIKATGFVPHANQIRFFIGNTQDEVYNYCKENNILVEAYSPLATGKVLDNPEILKMAEKYNVTPAKIAIRYCLEKGTLPLPKSTHEERIKANLDVDFNLSKEDVEILDKVHNPDLDRPLRS